MESLENKQLSAIRVKCYAGYRGEETPQLFFINQRKVAVVDILDRWLAPDHRYFKIRGDDQATYIIRHEVITGQWELTLFDGGNAKYSL